MIDPNNQTWQCPNCDEQVDGTLETCWQCGCNRTGEIDPSFKPVVYNKLINNQDQAICDRCGYSLRGLTDRRCPECGEEFDLVEGDTIPEPSLPENHPWKIKRRNRLLLWISSWMLIPLLVILIDALTMQYRFSEIVGNMLYVLLILMGLMFITTPVLFGLSLLPDNSSNSSEQIDARQDEMH